MSTTEPELEQTTKKAGRPRSAQSHQAIITATIELLAEEGLTGMSIEAVAGRAGVGKTTIYRRWNSKEDLVIDALKSIQIAQTLVDTGNIREDLLVLLRESLQIDTNAPLFGKLLLKVLADVENNPDIMRVFYTRLVAPRFERFTQMIERAQARGELRADIEPGLIISLFAGPFYFLFLSRFVGMAPLTPDADQVIDAILSGIAVQPLH